MATGAPRDVRQDFTAESGLLPLSWNGGVILLYTRGDLGAVLAGSRAPRRRTPCSGLLDRALG